MTRAEADQELAARVTKGLPWLKAAVESKNIVEVRVQLINANRLLEEAAGRLMLRVEEKAQ